MAAGKKTGGRKKGSLNIVSAARTAAIAASGETPLDYLLRVMRDDRHDYNIRVDAAKAAAPYVHPRLTAITGVDGKAPAKIILEVAWKGVSSDGE